VHVGKTVPSLASHQSKKTFTRTCLVADVVHLDLYYVPCQLSVLTARPTTYRRSGGE